LTHLAVKCAASGERCDWRPENRALLVGGKWTTESVRVVTPASKSGAEAPEQPRSTLSCCVSVVPDATASAVAPANRRGERTWPLTGRASEGDLVEVVVERVQRSQPAKAPPGPTEDHQRRHSVSPLFGPGEPVTRLAASGDKPATLDGAFGGRVETLELLATVWREVASPPSDG